MQEKFSIAVMLLMFTALVAGPGEDGTVAARGTTASDVERMDRSAALHDSHASSADMAAVCSLLDEGFIRPTDMDWVLARSEPLLTPDVVADIRAHAALLANHSATQRRYCYAISDVARQEQCALHGPAASMARVLESLSLAIEGVDWADTPYGELDLERWRRNGGRDRPPRLMFRYCTDALASLSRTETTVQARVR